MGGVAKKVKRTAMPITKHSLVIDWGTSSDLRKSMHLNIALVGVHFVPHD
jgi:hypothetical protein